MTRLGSRSQLAYVGIVALFVLAAQTRSVWLQAAACALTGLVAVSWLTVAFDKGCEVRLQHGDFVVGVLTQTYFAVENTGSRRSRPMVVRYWVESTRQLMPEVAIYVDPLAPGGRAEVRANVVPVARGEGAGRWSVARIGAFGLATACHTRTTEQRVAVAPASTMPVELPMQGGNVGAHGRLTAGVEVFGAREWRPGDAARHVHWRSTARAGRLTVLERAEPIAGTLGVLIAGTSGHQQFEELLAVGAATVEAATDEGVDCYAWLEQSGVGCVGLLSRDNFLVPFVRAEKPALPSERGLTHLLGHVGRGGTLLVVAPAELLAELRTVVAAAAAAADVTVVELSDLT
ncbi:MAG: DUF58 domain-containing protein [Acidothermaceae bacterium]